MHTLLLTECLSLYHIFLSHYYLFRLTRFEFKMYSNYAINLKIYYNYYVLIMVVVLDYDIVLKNI